MAIREDTETVCAGEIKTQTTREFKMNQEMDLHTTDMSSKELKEALKVHHQGSTDRKLGSPCRGNTRQQQQSRSSKQTLY